MTIRTMMIMTMMPVTYPRQVGPQGEHWADTGTGRVRPELYVAAEPSRATMLLQGQKRNHHKVLQKKC